MYIHVFQPSETIRSFDESIYIRKASIVEAEKDQSNLLKDLGVYNNKSSPQNKEDTDKKRDTYEKTTYTLYEGRELTEIFTIKATKGDGHKILTPKQMFQIALAQVEAGNILKFT